MVRAILDGTKTQTRRAIKPQPDDLVNSRPYWWIGGYRLSKFWNELDPLRIGKELPCPYGQPGDRLWVREAWARDDEDGQIIYRADVGHDVNADMWEQGRHEGGPRYRWRPSIHMPRAACRITLEIAAVRVERLHDISRGDAMAEGGQFPNMPRREDPAAWFAALWWQINGTASWDANPWVWVVEFRTLK
jgi:hypothetical protein